MVGLLCQGCSVDSSIIFPNKPAHNGLKSEMVYNAVVWHNEMYTVNGKRVIGSVLNRMVLVMIQILQIQCLNHLNVWGSWFIHSSHHSETCWTTWLNHSKCSNPNWVCLHLNCLLHHPNPCNDSFKRFPWLHQHYPHLSKIFINHTHGHHRPPSFIGIDSWSAKGSQTHLRLVWQLLAQTTGIPWKWVWVSIRPKGGCTTYLQDSTPFAPFNSLHINTEPSHVYFLAWLSYIYLSLCSWNTFSASSHHLPPSSREISHTFGIISLISLSPSFRNLYNIIPVLLQHSERGSGQHKIFVISFN